MRELFVIIVDNQQYGIWKDEIQSVKDIQTLHRLPLSPACIAGMSIIDDRTVTLADLPACIGHAPAAGNEKGRRILVLSGQDKITGFMVSGDIGSLSIPDNAVFPIPEYLKTEVINSCAIHNTIPIPIINVPMLYQQLLKTDRELPRGAIIISDAPSLDSPQIPGIRVFNVNGELFAASSSGMEDRTVLPGPFAKLSLVPQYVKGIAFYSGGILPVIDLSQRIKRQKIEINGQMLVAEIRGSKFGLLVNEDQGTWSLPDITMSDLPPIAQLSWLRAAVLNAREIIPLVDLPALLSVKPEDQKEKPLEQRYVPDSEFYSVFMKQDVAVVEFSLLNARHALPKSEVEDIISFRPYREIPDVPEIVIGVAEHNGALLPVLDLAMVFGRRSLATPEWRMMLVKNGDFRALVITETVFGERRLPQDIQRTVPILLPHRVVYGCYPEVDAVSLILNVEAMAVHFEKSLVKEFLPALSHDMMSAPAEIVHSLFDEEAGVLSGSEELNRVESITKPLPAIPVTDEKPGPVMIETVSITESFSKPVEEVVPRHEEQEQEQQLEQKQEEVIEQFEERVQEQQQHEQEQEQEQGTIVPEPEEGMTRQQVGESDASITPEPVAVAAQDAIALEQECKERMAASEETVSVSEESIGEQAGDTEEMSFEQESPAPANTLEETPAEETGAEIASLVDRAPDDASASSVQEEQTQASQPEPQPQTESEPELAPEPAFEPEPVPVPEAPQNQPATPIIYHDVPAVGSGRAWKRMVGYGTIAAVLAVLIYVLASFNTSPVEKPMEQTLLEEPSEQTPQANIEPVKVEITAPEPAIEKPEPPIVLEIPADRPVDIDVYEVVQGDTLWSVSERFTGNPFNYPRIASDNSIANPDLIFPGQRIRLKKK